MNEPELLVRVEGSLGRLTLNRPSALNALTPSMVSDLHAALREWANDPMVTAVLIDGAGERGLCAGGDLKLLYRGILEGSVEPLNFWAHEYEMNAAIAAFPKPYVAFMDGLTLGGGLGVSMHGSVRIVTERSQLAMPETAIGLFPDVGALYWLSRVEGGLGGYVALTGARMGAADAISVGLADYYWPAAALPDLLAGLRSGAVPDRSSAEFPPAPLIAADSRGWIDDCFTADSVPSIAALLSARPEPAAATALQLLRTMSPTSLKVTLAALRRAARLSTVAEVLAQDLRVSAACTRHPDLAEGIRAMLIEKDRRPRWRPDRWEDVSDDDVASFFC